MLEQLAQTTLSNKLVSAKLFWLATWSPFNALGRYLCQKSFANTLACPGQILTARVELSTCVCFGEVTPPQEGLHTQAQRTQQAAHLHHSRAQVLYKFRTACRVLNSVITRQAAHLHRCCAQVLYTVTKRRAHTGPVHSHPQQAAHRHHCRAQDLYIPYDR